MYGWAWFLIDHRHVLPRICWLPRIQLSHPSFPYARPRNATLDILERLIPNDPLKPLRERVANLAMDAVRTDNEENAVLAIKVRAYVSSRVGHAPVSVNV